MAISNSLGLPNGHLLPLAAPKRLSSIELALGWELGTQNNKSYVTTYQSNEFSVCLGKPGKEAHKDYAKLNENDMTPTILFRGQIVDFFPTFSDIFRDFQRIASSGISLHEESTLISLACLLYRSSFMLDHKLMEESFFGDGAGKRWHWEIPEDQWEILQNGAQEVGPVVHTSTEAIRIPIDVYLHLIDAIALNEDVKYQTNNVKTFGKVQKATGRINTLQTLTTVLAVFLNRYPLYKFAGALIKGRGVAGLSVKAAKETFPELSVY